MHGILQLVGLKNVVKVTEIAQSVKKDILDLDVFFRAAFQTTGWIVSQSVNVNNNSVIITQDVKIYRQVLLLKCYSRDM